MGAEYLSEATVFSASHLNKNEAWIEVKEVLLKHFLPDNHQKLVLIKQHLAKLKERIAEYRQRFEAIVQKKPQQESEEGFNELRVALEDVNNAQEEFNSYNNAFHSIINEHPLLASYSNILVIVSVTRSPCSSTARSSNSAKSPRKSRTRGRFTCASLT